MFLDNVKGYDFVLAVVIGLVSCRKGRGGQNPIKAKIERKSASYGRVNPAAE